MPQYVKIVELLCRDKEVPLFRMKDPKLLSELAGIYPIDHQGDSTKGSQCNSLVVKDAVSGLSGSESISEVSFLLFSLL